MNKYFLFFLVILVSFNSYSMKRLDIKKGTNEKFKKKTDGYKLNNNDYLNRAPKEVVSELSKRDCLNKLPKEIILEVLSCIIPPTPLDKDPSESKLKKMRKSYDYNKKSLLSFLCAYSFLCPEKYKKYRIDIEKQLRRITDAREKEYINSLAKIGGIDDLNSYTELKDCSQNKSLINLHRVKKQNKFILKHPILLFHISKFSISDKSITEIPSIGNLKNLSELALWGNKITEIPTTIGNLTNLSRLDLGCNKLTEIPSTVGNLTNISNLSLWGNKITEIPSTIGNLTNLSKLFLGDNKITEIPSTIGNLTNLYSLSLFNNKITEIPSTIGSLTNLNQLYLGGNKIMEIPSAIGNLTNLSNLSLCYNKIKEIPSTIGNLTNLSCLNIKYNPLGPEEIRRTKKFLPGTHVLYQKKKMNMAV